MAFLQSGWQQGRKGKKKKKRGERAILFIIPFYDLLSVCLSCSSFLLSLPILWRTILLSCLLALNYVLHLAQQVSKISLSSFPPYCCPGRYSSSNGILENVGAGAGAREVHLEDQGGGRSGLGESFEFERRNPNGLRSWNNILSNSAISFK